MKKKFKKGDENWMAFIDLYQFVQDFWEPEIDERYWDAVIEAGTKLRDKYKDNEFIKRMVLAYIDSREKELAKR